MGCVDRLGSRPIAGPGPNRTPGELRSVLWFRTEPGTLQPPDGRFQPDVGLRAENHRSPGVCLKAQSQSTLFRHSPASRVSPLLAFAEVTELQDGEDYSDEHQTENASAGIQKQGVIHHRETP